MGYGQKDYAITNMATGIVCDSQLKLWVTSAVQPPSDDVSFKRLLQQRCLKLRVALQGTPGYPVKHCYVRNAVVDRFRTTWVIFLVQEIPEAHDSTAPVAVLEHLTTVHAQIIGAGVSGIQIDVVDLMKTRHHPLVVRGMSPAVGGIRPARCPR